MKILGKEEPTIWVRRVQQLYVAARMLGTLPAPGGLMDQERNVARAFTELAQMDYEEDRMFKMAISAKSMTGM